MMTEIANDSQTAAELVSLKDEVEGALTSTRL